MTITGWRRDNPIVPSSDVSESDLTDSEIFDKLHTIDTLGVRIGTGDARKIHTLVELYRNTERYSEAQASFACLMINKYSSKR